MCLFQFQCGFFFWCFWPVKQFCGPLKTTFSSWIQLLGLSGARKVRASSLRHKNFCNRNIQTLFVEVSIVRQLYSLFGFFWLARFVFSDVWAFSDLCDIWMGLIDLHCGVFFLKDRFCIAVLGVLWWLHSRPSSSQKGYVALKTWKLLG